MEDWRAREAASAERVAAAADAAVPPCDLLASSLLDEPSARATTSKAEVATIFAPRLLP
jgi:hypothetical protein